MTKVGFHPAAALELREAATFYESRVPGLGEEFINDVERTCASLGENASLGARYDSQCRRALLRRFPFTLIYQVQDASLTIIAVAHTKKRPAYWHGRTET